MRAFQKPLLIVVFSIILFIAGFIFLLRGCLSRYDERSAIAPALYFEKGDRSVILSIVKFEEATSYSQNGGFINKTVSTSYYIQVNDALTAKKIDSKRIRHQRDLHGQPVEVLGGWHNTAWVFIGEPMAFDPFTLDKIADKNILEKKNPFIKGQLPTEKKYYQFNSTDSSIHFIATDGRPLQFDLTTLLITRAVATEETITSPALQQLKTLEIPRNFKERDSLAQLIRMVEKKEAALRDIRKKIESLNGRSTIYFNQAKSNMDTLNGAWYGLYTPAELEKMYDRFEYAAMYNETGRRQLLVSTAGIDRNGDLIISKENATALPGFFLDGGFLLNKQTGVPIHLNGAATFLLLHKTQVGAEGRIQLSSVDTTGKIHWTFNTQLKEWSDWIYTGRRLFVFGTNNKNLSSGEVNILWSIDLGLGVGVKYDYFETN